MVEMGVWFFLGAFVGVPIALALLGRLTDWAQGRIGRGRPVSGCPYEVERQDVSLTTADLEPEETEIPAVVAAEMILEEARGRR